MFKTALFPACYSKMEGLSVPQGKSMTVIAESIYVFPE